MLRTPAAWHRGTTLLGGASYITKRYRPVRTQALLAIRRIGTSGAPKVASSRWIWSSTVLSYASMQDGDLVTAAVAVPRSAGPAATGTVPRSETLDAAEVAPIVLENDARTAGVSSAIDRRAAIADLMRAHGDAVLGLCIRVLGNRDLAEEVTQQTFLEAFRDFDRFQEGSRRAWLFGIASHRSLDALRRRQLRSKWVESDENTVINTHDPGTRASEQLEHAQLTAALEECMKSLPQEVRMTVLMRFQTELTYEELASQLSVRPDALQMRVTRALSKLRKCLESKGVYDA